MLGIFKDLVEMTVEIYVDDMVVKIRTLEDHLNNIQMIFDILDKVSMRLNPEKYIFKVRAEKYLGYIVSERGIETNPNKIKAIQDMESSKCINDIHKLNGWVTALG